MSDFFKEVGWILFGVISIVVALAFYYYAFTYMIGEVWGRAIGFFIGGIIFMVMSFVAFKRGFS